MNPRNGNRPKEINTNGLLCLSFIVYHDLQISYKTNKMKENLPRKDVYSKAVDNNSVKAVVKKSPGEPKPVPRPKCAINVNILQINFTDQTE